MSTDLGLATVLGAGDRAGSSAGADYRGRSVTHCGAGGARAEAVRLTGGFSNQADV